MESTEQKEVTAEQTQTPSETEVVETVSQTAETTVSEQTPEQQATEKVRIAEETTRLAQSMKDKELATIYQQLEALKKEKEELRVQQEERTREQELARQETAEKAQLTEAGVPEVTIAQFHQERRHTSDLLTRGQKEYEKLQADKQAFQAERNQILAIKFAMRYGLDADSFAKDIPATATPADIELKALKTSLAAKEPPKPKKPTTRPDSSLASAPGGNSEKQIRERFTEDPYNPKNQADYKDLLRRQGR